MKTDPLWVAFLRGMNLGGRRLANEELRTAVETCGCQDVATYQASGNARITLRRRAGGDRVDRAAGRPAGTGGA